MNRGVRELVRSENSGKTRVHAWRRKFIRPELKILRKDVISPPELKRPDTWAARDGPEKGACGRGGIKAEVG